jgi:DNA-binding transcriptional ArsR family regulator
MGAEIRLSSSEFKALASETRAGIIKLLKERNHTLTELSKKLRLAAPTIKQHLGILEGAELIQEMDEGRKWKYYCLTRKGKNIFSAETPVNVLIVLAVSIFALVGMLYSFLSMLGSQAMLYAADAMPRGEAFIGAADKAAEVAPSAGYAEEIVEGATVSAGQAFFPDMQVIVFLLTIVVVSLITGFFVAKAKRKAIR